MSFESFSLDFWFRGAHVKPKDLFRIRSSVAPSLNAYKRFILESKLRPRTRNSKFLGLIFLLIIVDTTAVKNSQTTKREFWNNLLYSKRRVTEAWYKGLPIAHSYEGFGAGSYNFMPLLELLNISKILLSTGKQMCRVLNEPFWIQIIADFSGLCFLQKATWSYLAQLFFSEGKSARRCFQMF